MKLKKTLILFCLNMVMMMSTSLANAKKDPNKTEPMATNEACTEGSTRTGYTSHTSSGNVPCTHGTQVCTSGAWQGAPIYKTCESVYKGCGKQAHGEVIHGYSQPKAKAGSNCVPAKKVCYNGRWLGPKVFPDCSEK